MELCSVISWKVLNILLFNGGDSRSYICKGVFNSFFFFFRFHRRNEAAIKIQAAWRGFTVRKWYEQAVQEQSFDMAVLQELHTAAIKIQVI